MTIKVWAMLATPFTADGRTLDLVSLARYVKETVARGCAGVVTLGVIGEPAALNPAERIAAVRTALSSAGVPVLVGLMHHAADDRLGDAELFAASVGGAPAGYLVPIMTADPRALRSELEELHAACGRPLVVQDHPGWSGVRIEVDDLASAIEGLPWVDAIKCEASPTFGRIRRLHDVLPGVRLMSGMGGLGLIDDLAEGASAVASGISRPEIVVAAVAAWERGDGTMARALVNSIGSTIGFETQAGPSVAIRKEHWRRQGVIASATVRPPSPPYEAHFSALSNAHGFTNEEDVS